MNKDSSAEKSSFLATVNAWRKDRLLISVYWSSADKGKVVAFDGRLLDGADTELDFVGIGEDSTLKVRFDVSSCKLSGVEPERARADFPDKSCLLMDLLTRADRIEQTPPANS